MPGRFVNNIENTTFFSAASSRPRPDVAIYNKLRALAMCKTPVGSLKIARFWRPGRWRRCVTFSKKRRLRVQKFIEIALFLHFVQFWA